MNFSNQEQIVNNYNNNHLRKINYNSNNIKITKKREKLKSEKSNPEIVEFKSQDNLIIMKNQRPIQNIDLIRKDNNNEQKQLYDSNNTNINKNINSNGKQHTNKSNSSVKINTKVNCKKYFGVNNSKKMINSNSNNGNYYSNDTNYKEKINSSISSNNFNIIFPGQKSVKINGNKMIKHYNNSSNNVNNYLAMTKSSIQISGNYPLNQSQNIYNIHSRIESMELNIEGNDLSKEKFNINNNENYNNKEKDIKKKYIINKNNKNKMYLIKREPINRIIKRNSDKLTNELIGNKNFACKSNQIDEEKRNRKIYDNYSSNNFKKSNLVELDKNSHFVKNNNEYNNIFFYNSNNNKNDINENFENFGYRENINGLDLNEYNNDKNYNYNNNYIKNKSNEISANAIKESKIKNKFVYKKSGNLSEKKLMKINSTKTTSYIKDNDGQFGPNYKQKIIQRINKEKGEIKDKKLKTNNILKNKRSDEIKIKKDINYYYERQENKSKIKNEINNKIIIKKMKVKNKLKNTSNIIDFKLKIPDGKDLDKEVIIPINIKEDDIPKKVENIIKDYSIDNSYYEPLLSLINNSIDILNNLDSIKIEKENYNSLSFKNSKENS